MRDGLDEVAGDESAENEEYAGKKAGIAEERRRSATGDTPRSKKAEEQYRAWKHVHLKIEICELLGQWRLLLLQGTMEIRWSLSALTLVGCTVEVPDDIELIVPRVTRRTDGGDVRGPVTPSSLYHVTAYDRLTVASARAADCWRFFTGAILPVTQPCPAPGALLIARPFSILHLHDALTSLSRSQTQTRWSAYLLISVTADVGAVKWQFTVGHMRGYFLMVLKSDGPAPTGPRISSFVNRTRAASDETAKPS